MRRIAVVGAGLAAATAVEALRERGYDGRLCLIGGEDVLPYDRPPLSKSVLAGTDEHSTLAVDYAGLDIELRLGSPAVRLEPDRIQLADGTHVPYDGALLCCGSRPRRLPGAPEVPGVLTLRDIGDAWALRERLVPGSRVVVVGAGWIGAEVATTAVGLGCAVTVVEAAAAPALSLLGDGPAAVLARWHRGAGVDLRVGTTVRSITPLRSEALRVDLADGDSVVAETILVGIGADPAVEWLGGSPVRLSQGVETDAYLDVGTGNLFAAGDIAAWPSARTGRRMRVEHWDHAIRSARVAAANLLGARTPYDAVPYFWSDQFGRRLQYVGRHSAGDELVVRGAIGDPDGWTGLWLRGDLLVAALSIDRPRDCSQARRLIEECARLDRARAAQPSVPLVRSVLQTDAVGGRVHQSQSPEREESA